MLGHEGPGLKELARGDQRLVAILSEFEQSAAAVKKLADLPWECVSLISSAALHVLLSSLDMQIWLSYARKGRVAFYLPFPSTTPLGHAGSGIFCGYW